MKLITNKEQCKDAAIFLLNKRYGNLKEYRTKKDSNYVFYYNPENKENLMQLNLKKNILWVKREGLWLLLQMLFDYNHSEVQGIIKIWVEEAYNLKGVTPLWDVRIVPATAE